jgi:hypothetical protein
MNSTHLRIMRTYLGFGALALAVGNTWHVSSRPTAAFSMFSQHPKLRTRSFSPSGKSEIKQCIVKRLQDVIPDEQVFIPGPRRSIWRLK